MLNYIAATKQIKTCKRPELFLVSYKKYKQSKLILFHLKKLLSFFEILSRNQEFQLQTNFLTELLNILELFPLKDVIHAVVFQILDNKIDTINKNPKLISAIVSFVLKNLAQWKIPIETKKKPNSVSLHFVFQLLQNLDYSLLEDKNKKEKIQNEKDLLATIFTKLCFSENDNDISDIVEVSEVIHQRDLNFFKKGSRLIPENDKRFHYEDNIL